MKKYLIDHESELLTEKKYCDICEEEIEQGHLCHTCQNEILDDFKEEE